MGKPGRSHVLSLPAEYIGWVEKTRGTETSKYPEEEKSTEIPRVVAIEMGSSLNPCMCKPEGVAACGVVGPTVSRASDLVA
jgi:hypothetical protein